MSEKTIKEKLEDEKRLSDFQVKKIDLYLEQIKYITAENNSIQEKFLAGVDIPLAALGIMIYYIESKDEVNHLYLILPFFCLFIFYNLIKYTVRIFINNGYLQHLESQINNIVGEKIFLMNQGLRDTSTFKKLGFAVLTTGAQVPIYIAIGIFLGSRFVQIYNLSEGVRVLENLLIVLLIIELIILAMMGRDAIKVRRNVVEELKRVCEKDKQ